ncbi:Pentatricopeptide repeat-containing protein [Sesamum alatum]|uniref:Pentatricopeptide repeat-containing protein n=1 Tax=Sesamum alatum TaxID=300844 RepID=A0AAE2CLB1_9LAMI|nr:Pentatricopeptide repeat-containing protein [Sesamum alatum]
MNPKPLYLRTLFRSLSLRSSLFSSSFSSKTQLIQAAKPQEPCFRSSENDDPLISRSERDSKLKESVEHLCRQKRLKDVIQFLEKQVPQPSAALYTTILQLCIEKRALDEGKRVHAHIKRSGLAGLCYPSSDNSRCAGKCKLRSLSKLITYSRTSVMELKYNVEVTESQSDHRQANLLVVIL